MNSLAFERFENLKSDQLSEIDGEGYILAALAGIGVGVGAALAAPETGGTSIAVGVKYGVPAALAGLATHLPGLPAWI
ncbi:hypothetical protein [Streptococcus devriesei]|uniref:hypothetical protein n=1 Tax=Streptococcus devriesei TaxID=231233 RepID=UPI00040DCC42|nr:hypothetical protein [Streptococcus devriesei]